MAEPLRGALERADHLGVAGWARRGAAPVTLMVSVSGHAVASVRAEDDRPDLSAEGDGACAFEVWFDTPLPPGQPSEIRVCTADGEDLPGSPRLVSRAAGLPRGTWLVDQGAPLALVVDAAVPDAGRDAGSVVLLSHMASLRRLGFSVAFTPLARAESAIAGTAGQVRVAYLHRLLPMALLEPAIRAANPGVHVVWSVADLPYLRAYRQALVLGGTAPPGLYAAERAAVRAADAVVTHSPVEAAMLERLVPRPRAHWVPWSVPPRPNGVPFMQRIGIGFIGSYGHAANQDALRLLLDEIFPLVWRSAPIPCVLAGRLPPPWLRQRAADDPRVRLVDTLTDTLDLWRQVRVSAAPLRFGSGVKGEVLDSLAGGVPCVSSPIAAEGLELPAVFQAADVPAMAAALLHLHGNQAANAEAANAGLALLAARHTDAVVDRALSWALAPH